MPQRKFRSLAEYVAAKRLTMTQGEVARALGVSEAALSLYLSRRRFPRRALARQLERQTGIPAAHLMGLDNDEALAS